ncbi:SUMF1/EgtB/PvdO family nonheme iron enzyme [Pirellulaceae bacterium SH449]
MCNLQPPFFSVQFRGMTWLVSLLLLALLVHSSHASAPINYALMVGITQYEHSVMNGDRPLLYPEKDAKRLGMLLESYGYEVEYLLGPDATQSAIQSALKQLSTKGRSNGVCVVGLFGHGVEMPFSLPNGEKEVQGCFCPVDTAVRQVRDADGQEQFKNQQPLLEPNPETLVKMSEVVGALATAKASSRMLIADCCREMPNRARGRNLGLGANFSTDRLPRQTVMLFGCRPGEQALERDDWEHGAFTKALIEELERMTASFESVTSGTLGDRVKRRVQQMTDQKQNPTPVSLDSIDLLLERSAPLPLISPFSASEARAAQEAWGRYLGQDWEQTNSLGMKLKLIPAGTFMMGSKLSAKEVHEKYPGGEESNYTDEHPRHRVTISRPIYMGIHEVTVGQFRRFVEATNYCTDAERDGQGGMGLDMTTGDVNLASKYSWCNPGLSQEDSEPVVNVSWNDAVAFCEWLSRKESRIYRLPTEAEWEYAARAGSESEFHFGDVAEDLTQYENVADGTAKAKFPGWTNTLRTRDGFVTTSPVGSFRPNGFGLYDMHGNVSEWCRDWYGPYRNTAVTDPVGPSMGEFTVSRGGGCFSLAWSCRSAKRYDSRTDNRGLNLGFRLVSVIND